MTTSCSTSAQGSPSCEVPPSILAFRTITTMLSQIHDPAGEHITKIRSTDKSRRRNLRLLNSFAAIIVRELEITAVTANTALGSSIEVVVSRQIDSETKLISPQNTSAPSWSFRLFPPLIFKTTYNPRRTHQLDKTLCPTKDAPMIKGVDSNNIPRELAQCNIKDLYDKYLRTLWGKESFETHVWIISQLLVHAKTDPDPLFNYIVASSFRKIARRINSSLSMVFFNCLTECKITQADANEADCFAKKPTDAQKSADTLFAQSIVEWPLENIKRLVSLATHSDKGYYTAETCLVFHQVLISLLRTLKKNLASLTASGTNLVLDADHERFLIFAQVSYRCLLFIADGSALEPHLKLIEHMLQMPPVRRVQRLDSLTNPSDDPDFDAEEDFGALQYEESDEPVPIWKSYSNWFKLLLIHFRAANDLAAFITATPHESFSVKLLVPPRISSAMLPWRTMLESDYFTFFQDNSERSEVISYLREYSDIPPVLEKYKNSKNSNLNLIVKDLNNLRLTMATKIATRIQQDPSNWKKTIAAELDNFAAGKKHCRLLNNLPKSDQASCDSFIGSLHCEVTLASFFSFDGDGYQDVQELFKDITPIIGVSKLCCPVCYALLGLLNNKDELLVRGSHVNITACTLPTWLPEAKIAKMNELFGSKLGNALRKLMESGPSNRGRSNSSGSDAPSESSNPCMQQSRNTHSILHRGSKSGLFEAWQRSLSESIENGLQIV